MMTVLKHQFKSFSTITDFFLPEGSTVLCAKNQDEHPTIWFLCDPDEPKAGTELRRIAFVETGQNADGVAGMKYLDTLLFEGGSYVLHVFIDR